MTKEKEKYTLVLCRRSGLDLRRNFTAPDAQSAIKELYDTVAKEYPAAAYRVELRDRQGRVRASVGTERGNRGK
jgi:hypothetical protein